MNKVIRQLQQLSNKYPKIAHTKRWLFQQLTKARKNQWITSAYLQITCLKNFILPYLLRLKHYFSPPAFHYIFTEKTQTENSFYHKETLTDSSNLLSVDDKKHDAKEGRNKTQRQQLIPQNRCIMIPIPQACSKEFIENKIIPQLQQLKTQHRLSPRRATAVLHMEYLSNNSDGSADKPLSNHLDSPADAENINNDLSTQLMTLFIKLIPIIQKKHRHRIKIYFSSPPLSNDHVNIAYQNDMPLYIEGHILTHKIRRSSLENPDATTHPSLAKDQKSTEKKNTAEANGDSFQTGLLPKSHLHILAI